MKKQDLIQEKDYKQLYEDALNKVKELQKDWKSTGNRAAKEIEEAFPQLAEPKDEQTRKAILNHMKMYAKINGVKSFDTISTEDILDYLERIKEPIVEKVIYIPKFRLGNLVVSTNNRDLTYHILGTKKSEQGVDCYVTDTFKSGVFACTNLMPIESMDEWGELVAENFDNEQQDRSSMVEALRLEYEKGRADAIAEGDVIKSVKINGLPPVTGNKVTDITPWRPTKKQMDKLYAYAYGCPDSKDAEVLFSLYDDLNALCENKPLHWNKNVTDGLTEDKDLLNVLVGLINWSGTPWSGVDKDKFVDFLNKRFMNRPTDEEMIRTLRCEYEKGVADTIAKYEEKTAVPTNLSDDEMIREAIIGAILTATMDECTRRDCLAYLEKQKEQKPADYDHEMWKNCEANFEGGKAEVISNPEKYGLSRQKSIGWNDNIKNHLLKLAEYLKYKGREDDAEFLESLIPSWIPTDEQYFALRDATIKLDADDSDARFPWPELPILHSLLNDLFELRKMGKLK